MSHGSPDWVKSIMATTIIDNIPEAIEAARSFIEGRTFGYEDDDFVTGDSPATLNVYSDLGRKAHDGFLINDGPGDLKYEITNNGVTWGSQHTMKKTEVLYLFMIDVYQIRLTWVSDAAYRCLVL